MTRAEERNKAAFEAYPENISYSTVIEQYVDYNRESREIWLKGAEWADEHPKEGLVDINKACEFLTHYCNQHGVYPTKRVEIIEQFKKAMEE